MAETVLARLVARLDAAGIPYATLHHAPVFTSAEAAQVRGTALSSGAKALICRCDHGFVMFVIPADRKLAATEFRKSRRIKSFRFASRDEVLAQTGLSPGSIPPFGSLFGMPTFCDPRLGEHESINFNAGDHAVSVSMKYADYVRLEQPELGSYSSEETA